MIEEQLGFFSKHFSGLISPLAFKTRDSTSGIWVDIFSEKEPQKGVGAMCIPKEYGFENQESLLGAVVEEFENYNIPYKGHNSKNT